MPGMGLGYCSGAACECGCPGSAGGKSDRGSASGEIVQEWIFRARERRIFTTFEGDGIERRSRRIVDRALKRFFPVRAGLRPAPTASN
jgi:hypothetical protein